MRHPPSSLPEMTAYGWIRYSDRRTVREELLTFDFHNLVLWMRSYALETYFVARLGPPPSFMNSHQLSPEADANRTNFLPGRIAKTNAAISRVLVEIVREVLLGCIYEAHGILVGSIYPKRGLMPSTPMGRSHQGGANEIIKGQ